MPCCVILAGITPLLVATTCHKCGIIVEQRCNERSHSQSRSSQFGNNRHHLSAYCILPILDRYLCKYQGCMSFRRFERSDSNTSCGIRRVRGNIEEAPCDVVSIFWFGFDFPSTVVGSSNTAKLLLTNVRPISIYSYNKRV
jgi:hypothetical protein